MQVEDDEAEIGVAREQIGGLQRHRQAGAAHPEQVHEQIVRVGGGIEAVGAVDQRDAPACGAGDGEQLREQQVAATARRGADDLGEGAEWQAAGELIDCGELRRQHASRRARRGGKPLGEEMPERRQNLGRGSHERKAEAAEGGSRERGSAREFLPLTPGRLAQRLPDAQHRMAAKNTDEAVGIKIAQRGAAVATRTQR
jgi:hypothetical protein